MPNVRLESLVFTGIVTLESGIQLMYFARQVYFARVKYGTEYPSTTGNADFERVYRAQQNTLEWYPVFMTTLWTSSLFLHQVPASVCGAVYLLSRHRYFKGYSRSVEERLPGFKMAASCLMAMTAMAAVGLVKTLARMNWNDFATPVINACRFK